MSRNAPERIEATYEAFAVKRGMLDLFGRWSPGCPSPLVGRSAHLSLPM